LTQSDIGGEALALLLASEDALEQLCFRISAASLFGRRAICGVHETLGDLAFALPSITLQQLRKYNLSLGAALLRSLNYLHLDQTIAVQSGIRFLEAQQRHDGAFGFFALKANESEGVSDKITIHRLYLQTTINCMWAIAEICTPNFRLI
jgi:hypothetical protein